MLPPEFRDLFQQLIGISIEEIAAGAKQEFSRRSADSANRGHLSPQHTQGLHHENAIWCIRQRITSGWHALQRVLEAHPLSYSDNLASDLKALIVPLASEEWCEKLMQKYCPLQDDQRGKFTNDLLQERKAALTEINTAIDLWSHGIKNRTDAIKPVAKELEQKFGILLSAKQAQIDFDLFVRDLQSLKRSLAIFFVDIDNFKSLNSQYTETLVDKTILPQAMRLIKGIASLRGDAYRHGGEEFLIVLPNVDECEATAFAEKLRKEFESYDFKVSEVVHHLTISIGVALWPQHGSTYDEILEGANHAEKEAKASKNSWVLANSNIQN
jgi:diguanylate cyclase (GGDEF)-like protein